MATLLKTWSSYWMYSGGSNPLGDYDAEGRVKIWLESQNYGANTSYIRVEHCIQTYNNTSSNIYYNISYIKYRTNVGSYGGTYTQAMNNFQVGSSIHAGYQEFVLYTEYKTIYHNPDGSCRLYVNGSTAFNDSGGLIVRSLSFNIDLPTIPRSPSYSSINASNITLNSARLTASIDTKGLAITAGGWDLSTDGGATWTYYDGDVYDKTITGLTPNTQYWYRGYVATSGGGTNSWWGSFTTTAQAIITNTSVDFDIDNGITLTFTNPSGLDVDLYLESPDNTVRVTRESITSPYVLSLTIDEKNTLFGLAPTSNSLAFRFKLRTDNNDGYISYKSGNAIISNANPTFNNFTYQDINTTTVALTGNNQSIIKGYSNLKAIITSANKAVALKGATMSKYRLVVGEKQIDVDYSSTATVELTLNAIDNNVFTVYAIDSRGNSTSKVISPSTYFAYTKPSLNPIKVSRVTPVDTHTILSYEGSFFVANFGSQSNTVTATYRYRVSDSDTWVTGTTNITPTMTDGNYSFEDEIAGDLSALGFSVNESFVTEITISDKLTNNTKDDETLGSGEPNIAYHKNGIAVKMPYDETITEKSFQVGVDSFLLGNVKSPNNYSGWNKLYATLTYSDANTLTSDVDLRPVLTKYNKLKLQQEQPLTAYWNLDTNANSQVGTFNGTETAITHSAGKFGNGAVFNGTSSKIVFTDNTALKPTGAFTKKLWFKTNATGTWKRLWQSFSANSNPAGITITIANTNVLQFEIGNNTAISTVMLATTNVCDNNWHYVVLTYQNNYAQLYLDGKLEIGGYSVTPAYATTNYVRIGCANVTGTDVSFMNGLIDDVALINGYALDEQTIYAQYISGIAQGTGNILIDKMFVVTDITETTVKIDGGYDFALANSTITLPMFSLNDIPYNFKPEKYVSHYTFSGTYVSQDSVVTPIIVNVPKAGIYIVSLSYIASQGAYADNIIDMTIGNLYKTHDIRQTWNVGDDMTNTISLNKGNQTVASINIWRSYTVNWKVTLTYIGV